ncbi:MAG: FxsA family protein [Pseudomonadota bacterium]
MWLFALFVAIPLIEIALFIQIGGLIGLWPTLLIVVATALLGTALVRSQGMGALENLRKSFSELGDPTEPLAHGAMILFSGALLLTPGFFTDAVGFALLIPGVRSAIYQRAKSRVEVQQFSYGPQTGPQGATIDGEFEEVEEVAPRPRTGPSRWTDDTNGN